MNTAIMLKTIDVLSTLALRTVLVAIADGFTAQTGLSFAATYKSTNMTLGLIAEGRTADMTIVTREAMDKLKARIMHQR
jgi:hypothetical protein